MFRCIALFLSQKVWAAISHGSGLTQQAIGRLGLLLSLTCSFLTPGWANIRTAADIRRLSVTEAQQATEVTLEGTVTFLDVPGAVFLQDHTAGTFFRPQPGSPTLALGDVVRVIGRTAPGLYLPGLGPSQVEILSKGSLPRAIDANYEDLWEGRYHYQRIALQGIVRSQAPVGESRSLFKLAVGSRVVEVRVEAPLEKDLVYIDRRVRVEGLAAGFINERRQLVQPYLWVSSWSHVTTEQLPASASDLPLVAAESLLAFNRNGQSGHRVRIRGVVTAVFPGGLVYLRSESTPVAVRLPQNQPVQSGDRVELAGFPEMTHFSASLGDAELLQREDGELPAPLHPAVDALFAGKHDGEWVTVEALLTEQLHSGGTSLLMVNLAGRPLQVRLPEPGISLQPGTLVRLTGICQVDSSQGRSGYISRADSVSLRLRSATDVLPLRLPPWWTARRLGYALVLVLGIVLGCGLWIALLRRQVSRQTSALKARIETEAALEERHRIAREFHDTLEQDLAGLSLRLGAVPIGSLDGKSGRLISASTRLVSRIQAETRNLLLDLRAPAGKEETLADALRSIAEQRSSENDTDIQAVIGARVPELSTTATHHLRMIATEAVTNALKHAQAKTITLGLNANSEALALTIEDDGVGLPAELHSHPPRGHFGCIGIRERCRKLGAHVAWGSDGSRGTRVEVLLPLPPAHSVRTHHSKPLVGSTNQRDSS